MAGITHLEEFQEEALQGLVDEAVAEATPSFADIYLPTVNTFDRKFVYDIVKNNKFMASYIGMGAEPPVVDRQAVANRHAEVAQFGLQNILTYEELVAINAARNNAERQATLDKVLGDTIDLVEATLLLIQTAKLEALLKGQHEVTIRGGKVTFDFGIPAENKIALTAGNDLDNPDFDILGFLIEQAEAYADQNGKNPDGIYVSRELYGKMATNSTLIAEAGRTNGANRISAAEMNEVFGNYGLVAPTVVTNRFVTYKANDEDKVVRREVMPVNRIVMLGTGAGEYKLGPTLENNYQPGIYLAAKDKEDPIRSITETVGAGFPVVENPFLIRHIDAYTPA